MTELDIQDPYFAAIERGELDPYSGLPVEPVEPEPHPEPHPERGREPKGEAPRRGPARPEPRRAVAVPVAAVCRRRVEWLLPGRVPAGALTVLVGEQGLGKSLWVARLTARLTRGELPGGPGAALLVAAEDAADATIRPRLEAAGADLDRAFVVRLSEAGVEAGVALPRDAGELSRLVQETQARLLVIDPVTAHLEGLNTWRDADVRSALAPLVALAEQHGCAILAVAHLNKGNGTDPLKRTGGSVAFTAAARSVLLLARDPEDPGGESGSRRALAHVKCNVAALAPSLALEVEGVLLPPADGLPEVETARIVEVGESRLSGRDLLAAAGMEPAERGAEGDAREFLREALRDGPRPADELKREARAAGVSGRTLDRARVALGVASRRERFGGCYIWHPPASMLANRGANLGEHGGNPMPAIMLANFGEHGGNRMDTRGAGLRSPHARQGTLIYGEHGEHGEHGEADAELARLERKFPDMFGHRGAWA